jgi:thiol-disulfide isomerase/thioredoxin
MFLSKSFSNLAESKFVSPQANRGCYCIPPPFCGEFFFRHCLEAFAAVLLLLSTPTALAVAVGDAAPGCVLSPIGESQNSGLSQYKGKVLYVDFWASWCGPCAKSFPFLNEMHNQLKDQGLQIVGVNLDENVDDAKAFLAKHPPGFTVAADVSKQCAKDFDVKAMPSSYIIDRKGIVHHVHLGFRAGEAKELRGLVEKLLNDKAAGL